MATNLKDVKAGYGLTNTINDNNDTISSELDDRLSRTAQAGNQMEVALDMNGQRIRNLAPGVLGTDAVTYDQILEGVPTTETALTQSSISTILYPDTTIEAAHATVVDADRIWSGTDDTPLIDIRRYGAAVDGVTNDYAAVAEALEVAKQRGGGRVFFPEGVTRIESQLVVTGDNIQLVGVSSGKKVGSAHEDEGSKIISTVTSDDVIQWGNGVSSKRNGGIIDLAVEASTTGALLYLNDAPFFKLEKAFLNNEVNGAGWGILAHDSHFFSAYDSRILKTTNQGTTDSVGVQFYRSGAVGGQYNFYGCDVQGWAVGVSCGQWGLLAWHTTNRTFSGSSNYPAAEDDVGLNFFGGQIKSCTTGFRLGSGCNQSVITGVYTEGTSFPVKVGYGASNALIQGNMFNMGTSSTKLLLGQGGGSDPERQEFWNIQLKGNWFRNIDSADPAISVTGNNSTPATDKSYALIHDNDFEINHASGLAMQVSGTGSDFALDVRRNTIRDPGGLASTYVSGLSSTIRPIRWEQTDTDSTGNVVTWTYAEQLTGVKQLRYNDPEILYFTTDGTNRAVWLPSPANCVGKRFVIGNYDAGNTLVIRDSSGNSYGSVQPKTGGTPDVIYRAVCYCDGVAWTVDISQPASQTYETEFGSLTPSGAGVTVATADIDKLISQYNINHSAADTITLQDGSIDGQQVHFYVTSSNAGDITITPSSLHTGTSVSMGASPQHEHCSLVWDDSAGSWRTLNFSSGTSIV